MVSVSEPGCRRGAFHVRLQPAHQPKRYAIMWARLPLVCASKLFLAWFHGESPMA